MRTKGALCFLVGLLFCVAAPAQTPPPQSTVQAKVEFPNQVIGLMDVTYASVSGYRPLVARGYLAARSHIV